MNKKLTLKKLFDAKAHFGHKRGLSHANSNSVVYGLKDGINIINLELTQQKLVRALEYISDLTKKGKTILFVGTKRQAKEPITRIAKSLKCPYVNCRWLGGTLTNYDTISKRIKYYLDLESKLNSPEAKDYTKKERTMWQKDMDRLAKFFEGLRSLKKIPDALFIIDVAEEHVAVTEANKINIPIIGTGSTNANPQKINYFIPINDNAPESVELVCEVVEEAIKGSVSKPEKSENKEKVNS